jgi:hypothetical protein
MIDAGSVDMTAVARLHEVQWQIKYSGVTSV